MDRFEPHPQAFNADPKFPPHDARILTPEELASIMGPTFRKDERRRFDALFSDMQDQHRRELMWLKVEIVVLCIGLVAVGALGSAAFFLIGV